MGTSGMTMSARAQCRWWWAIWLEHGELVSMVHGVVACDDVTMHALKNFSGPAELRRRGTWRSTVWRSARTRKRRPASRNAP